MRTTLALAGIGMWLTMMAVAPPASAQRLAPASQRIEALESQLADLRAQAAQLSTVAATVQDLSARLEVLQEELATREREQQAIPDAITRLDALDGAIAELAGEIAAVRTQVAGMQQPAATSPSGGGVVYKKGYRWITDDGAYSLSLGGFLQTRYQLEVADGEVAASSLRINRARVGMGGALGSRALQYKILLEVARNKPIHDFYVEYMFHEQVGIRFGQYKTQLLRSFLISSSATVFPDAPLAVNALRYDNDVQAGVFGSLAEGRLGYYAGVGNGAGMAAPNDNRAFNVSGRVDAVVLGERFGYSEGDLERMQAPALMVGASVVYDLVPMPDAIGATIVNTDVDGDGDPDNVGVISASADAVFRYRGVEALLEAIWRRESYGRIFEHPDNTDLPIAPGSDGTRDYLAAYAQITYVLPAQLVAGARVGWGDLPFLGLGGRATKVPAGDSVRELSAVVARHDQRRSQVLSLEYVLRRYANEVEQPFGREMEHQVVLEAQLKF